MTKFIPLTSGFMLTSILGLFISVMYVLPNNANWGFTFTLFFIIMFIASIISMSKTEVDDPIGLDELAIHNKKRKR